MKNMITDEFLSWLRKNHKKFKFDKILDALLKWNANEGWLNRYLKRTNYRRNEFLEVIHYLNKKFIKKINKVQKDKGSLPSWLKLRPLNTPEADFLYEQLNTKDKQITSGDDFKEKPSFVNGSDDLLFDDHTETESSENHYEELTNLEIERLIKISPIVGQITIDVLKASKDTQKALQKKQKDKLKLEKIKQEIEHQRAKNAIELIIAERIKIAEEIEIEEFFESEGEGNEGVIKTAPESDIGRGIKGGKVVKRIVRFRGVSNLKT